ncbi:ABC transporter substrate-binding protein [Halomicronema sp. CCY15110]|uniref:substrate-binding periplasmic protein n=1 Tax=Halomicronema sp. CCY15110 TaxID=2767773 RepID=UPI001EF370F6|nr:ABC transporter substrate-binding protein [Halomicronema sp. CCY15110]
MELATLTPGQLTIGASDFDARPMTYVEDGQRWGYEPDVARAVCAKLGLEPVWLNLPMAEFYSTLQAKTCDLVWFNQAVTPERQKHSVFTRPYGLFNEAIIVRADDGIESAADLAGRKMAGLADSTNVELGQQFEGVELIPFPGTDKVLQEMLAALRTGEVDAVVDDELVLVTAAEADPSLRLAITVETSHPFAIALRPDSPDLLTALNQTLDQLEADGTLQQLWEKWIPWRPFPFV